MMPQSLPSHINDINVDFEKENILNGSYQLKIKDIRDIGHPLAKETLEIALNEADKKNNERKNEMSKQCLMLTLVNISGDQQTQFKAVELKPINSLRNDKVKPGETRVILTGPIHVHVGVLYLKPENVQAIF